MTDPSLHKSFRRAQLMVFSPNIDGSEYEVFKYDAREGRHLLHAKTPNLDEALDAISGLLQEAKEQREEALLSKREDLLNQAADVQAALRA